MGILLFLSDVHVHSQTRNPPIEQLLKH